MKRQSFLTILTLANSVLLAVLLLRPGASIPSGTVPVLRGGGLEIVDTQGRTRASIKIAPADPTYKMPDGTTGYPETVLLRLMTPEGRPNLKVGVSEDGSGLLLSGADDPTYVQILSQGETTSLKLINGEGREQTIKP